MPKETKKQIEGLLQLINSAVKHDNEMREKYQIGQRFRFIQDRLNELLLRTQEKLDLMQAESPVINKDELQADEALVYVYIYNSQGLILKTWQNMLNPAIFYEYSVNRPIYEEKTQVEGMIRRKPVKTQHGYLTVVIKKEHFLRSSNVSTDAVGNPVIKVKEGALRFEKLVSFTHNDIEYIVSEDGSLQIKTS